MKTWLKNRLETLACMAILAVIVVIAVTVIVVALLLLQNAPGWLIAFAVAFWLCDVWRRSVGAKPIEAFKNRKTS
jgi:hypothetical protein